jgi:hypothetical protein
LIALGICLAIASACCYALAAACQHAAVHTVTHDGRLTWPQLRTLLAQRRWLLGLLALSCGGALHAAALSVAPLVVVQPAGVLAISLTALLATATGRARWQRTTGIAIAVTTVGIAAFVVLAARDSSTTLPPVNEEFRITALAAITVGTLRLLGRRPRGWPRCLLFAAAAGVCYGSVSTLTRVVIGQLRVDGLVGIRVGALFGIIAGIAVMSCRQRTPRRRSRRRYCASGPE